MSDAYASVAAVAAHGIPGSELDPAIEPLDEASWAILFSAVRRERITGLLAAAVTAGSFPITDAQAEQVVDAHVEDMAGVLLLERLLLTVAAALDSAGIEARVLKGTAVAHLDCHDPSLRPFGDIDLLVRPEQLAAVGDTLERLGLQPTAPQVRPDFPSRFGKGFVLRSPEGLEVDVHRTLAGGAYGLRVPVEDLWRNARPFVVGGTVLHALGDEERLLHAALHAAVGGQVCNLLSLRDVADMALYGDFDHDHLRALARRWGVEAALATTVRSAWEAFRISDVTALSRWAERHPIPAREARILAAHAPPRSTYAAQALVALSGVDGVRARVSYLTSLALPDRQFLQSRGYTRREWLSRGAGRSWEAVHQLHGRRRPEEA